MLRTWQFATGEHIQLVRSEDPRLAKGCRVDDDLLRPHFWHGGIAEGDSEAGVSGNRESIGVEAQGVHLRAAGDADDHPGVGSDQRGHAVGDDPAVRRQRSAKLVPESRDEIGVRAKREIGSLHGGRQALRPVLRDRDGSREAGRTLEIGEDALVGRVGQIDHGTSQRSVEVTGTLDRCRLGPPPRRSRRNPCLPATDCSRRSTSPVELPGRFGRVGLSGR